MCCFVQITLKDKYQLTSVAYATKHVPILKLLNCTDESIQQQAFVYAASNGSLDALEYMLTDNTYSSIDINGIDYVHGETGESESRNELRESSRNQCSPFE